jgi:hypothetical protein
MGGEGVILLKLGQWEAAHAKAVFFFRSELTLRRWKARPADRSSSVKR